MSISVFDDLGRLYLNSLRAFVDETHELVPLVLVLKAKCSHASGRDFVQARTPRWTYAFQQFVVFELWKSSIDVAPVSVETLRDIHTDISLTVAKSLQDLEVNRPFQLHYRILGSSHPKVPMVSSNVMTSVASQRSYQRYL